MESSDSDIDNDVPDTGAAFTFGKCKDQHEFIPEKYYFKMDAIKQVCCGDRHTAILTHASKLYSFGANDYGQLGHGHNRPVPQPKKIKALRNEPVALVACGRCHTIVYTESGRMYSCGMNTEGQLGIGRSSNDVTDFKFHLIPSLSVPQQNKITKIDCGADHAIALNSEGAAFSWGENELGQLGLGDSTGRTKPCRISLVRESVKEISCGYYHSALVTNSGKLWMFGDGESGQLGLSSIRVSQKESPECVLKFTEPVDLVSCGMSHTAVVTKSGQLFTFGTGKFGQLGHGPFCMRSNLPKPVEALRNLKITQVSCGENHTAVLSAKGQLIMFGDGKDGKLCQVGDEFANVFNPVPVLRFRKFKVLSFSLGACHSVVVAAKKNVGSSFDDSDDEEEDGLAGDAREKIGIYKFDYLGGTSMLRMAASMRKSSTLPGGGGFSPATKLSARDRRRARCMEKEKERLSQTLPIHWTRKLGSLPDLNIDSPKTTPVVIDVSSSPSKRSSETKPNESSKKPKTLVSSVDEVDSIKPLEDEIVEEPLVIGSKEKNVTLHASAPNLTTLTSDTANNDDEKSTMEYEYEYEYGDDTEINESLDTTNLSEKTADDEEEDDDDKDESGKKKGKFLGGLFSRKKQGNDADTSVSEKDSEKSSKSEKKRKSSKDSSNDTASKSKGKKDDKDKEKDKSKDKSSKRISWADEENATVDLSDDDVDAESNDGDSVKGGKSSKKDKKESKKEKEEGKEKKNKKKEEKSKKDKKSDKNEDHDSADEENGETKKKEEKKSGGGILSKIRKKKDEVEEFDPNDVPSDTEDEEAEEESSSSKKGDKKDKKKGAKDSKSKDKEKEDKKKKSKEDLTDSEDDEKKSKDKDKKSEKEKEKSEKGKEKSEKEKEKQEEKERKEREKQEEKERKEKEKQEEKEKKEKEKQEEKERKEKEKQDKEKDKKEKDKKTDKKKEKEKKNSKSKSDKKKKGDENGDDDAASEDEGSEEIEEISEEEAEKDKNKNKKEKAKKKVTINDDKGSIEDISEGGAKKKGLFGRFGK